MDRQDLLARAERALDGARELGLDDIEIAADWVGGAVVELEKNDINLASSDDEATWGVRVLTEGRIGFATTNDANQLEATIADAAAIARVSVADERNAFPDPRPLEAVDDLWDDATAAAGLEDITNLAADLLKQVRDTDVRASIDTGRVGAGQAHRIVASTRGVRAADSSTSISCGLFGMAVDGETVGSFVAESHASRRRESFEELINHCATRFTEKAVGALDPRPAESFRGAVVFTPEAARSLILSNLVGMASASAIRKGKSPLEGRLDDTVAAPLLTVIDRGIAPGAIGSASFDREGMPRTELPFIEDGVFRGIAYDHYEARAAGRTESTGHAAGGAGSRPMAGFARLQISPGETPLDAMIRDAGRTILVTRFSGSTDNVTGRFSGVVKAGFLLDGESRIPIAETLISGNILDAVRDIVAISSETETFGGGPPVPYFLIDGISVTAG